MSKAHAQEKVNEYIKKREENKLIIKEFQKEQKRLNNNVSVWKNILVNEKD